MNVVLIAPDLPGQAGQCQWLYSKRFVLGTVRISNKEHRFEILEGIPELIEPWSLSAALSLSKCEVEVPTSQIFIR